MPVAPLKISVKPIKGGKSVSLVMDDKRGLCYGSVHEVNIGPPIGWKGKWVERRFMAEGFHACFAEMKEAVEYLLRRSGYDDSLIRRSTIWEAPRE